MALYLLFAEPIEGKTFVCLGDLMKTAELIVDNQVGSSPARLQAA
jgi:hypothetical protein